MKFKVKKSMMSTCCGDNPPHGYILLSGKGDASIGVWLALPKEFFKKIKRFGKDAWVRDAHVAWFVPRYCSEDGLFCVWEETPTHIVLTLKRCESLSFRTVRRLEKERMEREKRRQR